MAALSTQARLESRVGARQLVAMADDDQDGVADAAIITWAIDIGSRRAEGILLGAFGSTTRIKQLVDADPSLQNDIDEICLGVLSTRRPSFLSPEGTTPLSLLGRAAEKRLREVADTDRGAAGEETAGQNDAIATHVNRDPTTFVFAASASNPRGPGGF